jgi:hypothetical protein
VQIVCVVGDREVIGGEDGLDAVAERWQEVGVNVADAVHAVLDGRRVADQTPVAVQAPLLR